MGPSPPATPETDFRLGHRPVLDGVRAVAILAVLAAHFGSGPKLEWPSGGFLGVDIFFVLSGFLITSILLEERRRTGSFSLRAFYVRRALRLFPALVLVVLAFLVYTLTVAPASVVHDNLIAAAATLTYWTNWLYAEGMFGVGQTGLLHAWTLSIEEQFYILWPLVLAAALLLGRTRAALAVAVGGIVAVVAWRLVLLAESDAVWRMYFGFDARADSLLVGCALALLLTHGKWLTGVRSLFFRLALVPAILLIGFCLVFAKEAWTILYAGGFTLFALATAVVLYNLVVSRPPILARLLEWSPMVYVGRISYGLYLWHFPIYLWTRDALEKGWLVTLVGLPLTFLLAAASFRYVEQPFLRYKKRFERRSRAAPEASGDAVPRAPAQRPALRAT
jgi:peptidoglycan/LPS O-acetylase OafA/YrhL